MDSLKCKAKIKYRFNNITKFYNFVKCCAVWRRIPWSERKCVIEAHGEHFEHLML